MKALLVHLCLLLPQTLLAQTVVRASFGEDRVAAGQPATVHIDFEDAKHPRCGLRIVFGDGEVRELLVDALPLAVTKTYSQPGTYAVNVDGTFVWRGLKSAGGCSGRATSGQLTVFDPVEEQRKADAIQEEEKRKQAEDKKKREAEKAAQELAEENLRLKQQVEKLKRPPPPAWSASGTKTGKPQPKPPAPAASKRDVLPAF